MSDLVEHWLRESDLEDRPDVESFTPTPDMPYLTLAVERTGLGAELYGVVYEGEAVNGSGWSSNRTWDWFDNDGVALREGLLRLWLKTDAGWEAREEALPDPMGIDDLTRAKTIHPMIGSHRMTVYRVIERHPVWGTWRWGFYWNSDDALDVRRDNLYHLSERDRDEIRAPLFHSLDPTRVPPVQDFQFGRCPQFGALLRCYRSVRLVCNNSRWEIVWFREEMAAKEHRTAVVNRIRQLKREQTARSELRAARDMCRDATTRFATIADSPEGHHFRGVVGDELYDVRHDWELGEGTTAARYLEVDEQATAAADALQAALDAAYLERLQLAESNGALKVLGSLLPEHIASCPICGTAFHWDEEAVENLAVFGDCQPECQCSETPWSRELPEDRPELFVDIENHEVRDEYGNIQTDVQLRHLLSDEKVLVRVVANRVGYEIQGVRIEVDVESFAGVATSEVTCFDAWAEQECPQRRAQFVAKADQEVEEERAVLIHLHWDTRRNKWQSRYTIDGVDTVYSVDMQAREQVTITQGRSYYCRLGRVIVNDESHKVILVTPFLEAS